MLHGTCDAHELAAGARLMEAALWAAARVADTYLLPDDAPASPALGAALGGGAAGGGEAALELLVRVAHAALTQCVALPYPNRARRLCLGRRAAMARHALRRALRAAAASAQGAAGRQAPAQRARHRARRAVLTLALSVPGRRCACAFVNKPGVAVVARDLLLARVPTHGAQMPETG